MPTVPEYGGPKVSLNPVSGARMENAGGTEAAFGGGAPAERVISAAKSLFESEREKASQSAVLEADTITAQKKAQLFYDPQIGAQNVKGKDALGISGPTMDEFKKFTTKIGEGLSSAERAAYQKLAMGHAQELSGMLTKHAANEYNDFREKTVQASITTARNEALVNYLDFGKVNESVAKQHVVISQHFAADPRLPNMLAESASSTYAGVLEQMTAGGESVRAKAILDTALKGKILPEQEKKLAEYIGQKIPQDVATKAYAAFKSGDASALVNGKRPLNPDGSPDLTKIEAMIRKQVGSTLDEEQLAKSVAAFDAYANKDMVALSKQNVGVSNQFYSKVEEHLNAGGSIQDANLMADKMTERMPDGSFDIQDRMKKYRYISAGGLAGQEKDDEAVKMTIWEGLGDGSITSPSQIMDFVGNGISAKTAGSYRRLLESGKAPAMKRQRDIISAAAKTVFPDQASHTAYMAGLEAQRAEQNIIDPVKFQALYDADQKAVKTGAPWFLGFGSEEKPSYAVQKVLHTNPELLRAIGGGAPAAKLAAELGGPDNFAVGSPYSNAVLSLKAKGIPPESMTKAKILAVVSARPDGVLKPEDKFGGK